VVLVDVVRMRLRQREHYIDLLGLRKRLVAVGMGSARFCHRRRLVVDSRLALPVRKGLVVVARRGRAERGARRSLGRGLAVGRDSAVEDMESGFHRTVAPVVAERRDHVVVLRHKLELLRSVERCLLNRRSLGWTCSCSMRSNLDR
jgi:hypothetical protein